MLTVEGTKQETSREPANVPYFLESLNCPIPLAQVSHMVKPANAGDGGLKYIPSSKGHNKSQVYRQGNIMVLREGDA